MPAIESATWDTTYALALPWQPARHMMPDAPRCEACGINPQTWDGEPSPRHPGGVWSGRCDECARIAGSGPRHVHIERGSAAQIAAGTILADQTWTTAYMASAIFENGRHVAWQCTRCLEHIPVS